MLTMDAPKELHPTGLTPVVLPCGARITRNPLKLALGNYFHSISKSFETTAPPIPLRKPRET